MEGQKDPYLVCVLASVIDNALRFEYMMHLLDTCRKQLRLPDLFVVSIYLDSSISDASSLESIFTTDLALNGNVRILKQKRPKRQFRQIMEMTERIPRYTRGREDDVFVCFVDDDDLVSEYRNRDFVDTWDNAYKNHPDQRTVVEHPFTVVRFPQLLKTVEQTFPILTCANVDQALKCGNVQVQQDCITAIQSGRHSKLRPEIHTTCVKLQAMQSFFKTESHMVDNRFCDQYFLMYFLKHKTAATLYVVINSLETRPWAYFYRCEYSYPRVTVQNINQISLDEMCTVILEASQVDGLKNTTIRSIWPGMQKQFPDVRMFFKDPTPTVPQLIQFAQFYLKAKKEIRL